MKYTSVKRSKEIHINTQIFGENDASFAYAISLNFRTVSFFFPFNLSPLLT